MQSPRIPFGSIHRYSHYDENSCPAFLVLLRVVVTPTHCAWNNVLGAGTRSARAQVGWLWLEEVHLPSDKVVQVQGRHRQHWSRRLLPPKQNPRPECDIPSVLPRQWLDSFAISRSKYVVRILRREHGEQYMPLSFVCHLLRMKFVVSAVILCFYSERYIPARTCTDIYACTHAFVCVTHTHTYTHAHTHTHTHTLTHSLTHTHSHSHSILYIYVRFYMQYYTCNIICNIYTHTRTYIYIYIYMYIYIHMYIYIYSNRTGMHVGAGIT